MRRMNLEEDGTLAPFHSTSGQQNLCEDDIALSSHWLLLPH